MNAQLNTIFACGTRAALALIFSFFIFPLVSTRAELSLLGDYDVFETLDDVNTDSNFYALDSEPVMDSPDQLSQEISGLISDPDTDTDLWAEVSDECFIDTQSTGNVLKRNDMCSDLGSLSEPGKELNPDQLRIPSGLAAGKEILQTVTSDDQDICRKIDFIDARFFAACESGLDNDRILNRITGEYSLLNCERGKLRGSNFAQVKPIIQTLEADERRQSTYLLSGPAPTVEKFIAAVVMSWDFLEMFVFKSKSFGLWAT